MRLVRRLECLEARSSRSMGEALVIYRTCVSPQKPDAEEHLYASIVWPGGNCVRLYRADQESNEQFQERVKHHCEQPEKLSNQ